METRFASGNMIDSDTVVLGAPILLVGVQGLVVCESLGALGGEDHLAKET